MKQESNKKVEGKGGEGVAVDKEEQKETQRGKGKGKEPDFGEMDLDDEEMDEQSRTAKRRLDEAVAEAGNVLMNIEKEGPVQLGADLDVKLKKLRGEGASSSAKTSGQRG